MKIDTALILCAGFGKRLNPITLDTPKPLLKINDLTLLDNCIKLVINLNIKKILINTFYLREKFYEFFKNHNYKVDIEIVEDGSTILDTGGGILNLINKSNDENFLVLNPDTIWNKKYIEEINMMIDLYFSKKIKNLLLLIKKDLSFDKDMAGDFGLQNYLINKKDKDYIYTGCQILNRSILEKEKLINFSITNIWYDLIENNQLYGFESKFKFFHVTNLKIFKKLQDL
jgi:N-acetyl-alpha-D-muramate 1-phosphate uridylyltransferase|tara:strand:- start:1779 stop:2465 length:687 start_codon:yes stop_codon:yes gene_type:complete